MAVSWIVFHITDRCQLNCKHCLRDPEKSAHDLGLGVMATVMDEARRVYGCEHIGLTGGEPTLHPQFSEIVDSIVDRGMTWHMISNGIRFDTKVIRLLDERPERQAAITAIDFSLDGATQPVHDRIRGDGSFRDVMKALTLCKMRDIPFMLQMTVNAYNHHEVEQFALMAAQLGASRASFGFTQPTGTYLDEEMFLPIEQWRAVQDQVARMNDLLNITCSYTDGFHSPQPFFECEPFRSEILHVDYHGKMNLCCQHAGVPGNHGNSDAIADMHDTSLLGAHRKMIEMVHQFRLDKLDAMERGELGEWDEFPCNYCMRYFGKPHWTVDGTDGATADRARWSGAWSPERHSGTEVPLNRRLRVIG